MLHEERERIIKKFIAFWPFHIKSIPIKCAKCQIFGIWHTKHQKTPLMRCSKCYNIWHTWIVLFHLWNDMDENAIKKLFIFSLFLYDFLSSLSFFFLLSFSTSPFIFCHSLFLFFFFFLLQNLHLSLFFSFFLFSITFSAPLYLSLLLLFLSPSLALSSFLST